MDIKKIVYFAAFFDVEGYVGHGFNERIEIRIANTYLPVLEQLKNFYDGHIYKRRITPKRHKFVYDWVITKQEDVIAFLLEIRPYLLEKKKRVESLLS